MNEMGNRQHGQTNLTSALFLIALVVAGIWIWNHLHYDTQDFIVEEIIPIAIVILLTGLVAWLVTRKIQAYRKILKKRDHLIQRFQQESSLEKRFDLAVTLIELNRYDSKKLEAIAPAMAEVFISTFKAEKGDKQHRIRGMAASHLGVLRETSAVPLLIQALEDDHAYVRGCAALALGRMRTVEAKEKLAEMMKEDWDQTVRSRACEAVKRMS